MTGRFSRPYLRVANIVGSRLDFSDLKEMDFDPADFAKYSLQAGDILLSEGQSPELVGESAVYEGGVPGLCFQKTLHRFRAVPGGPSTDYAHIVFLAYLHRQVFRQFASLTTSIAHLTLARFKRVPFPVPPREEQDVLVRIVRTHLRLIDRLSAEAQSTHEALDRFDQSTLAKAFRGELVPQDPNDEPASALLERIRAEREAAQSTTHVTRPRRSAAKVTGTLRPATAPPSLPSSSAPARKPRVDTRRLQSVLAALKRDALHRIADAEGVELADWRSLDAARDGLLQAGVTLEVALGHLDRDELKAVCRALGLEDRGRNSDELRARILREPEVIG